jgi:dynein intermediate chain, cytosolic
MLSCLQVYHPSDQSLWLAELTEEERASILAAPEFLDFVEQSSKIVQRALNDGYDYIRDYTINAESGG